MDRAQYDAFTERLRASLEGDGRVLGLVALGSMSGEPPAADQYSDHDFFAVVRSGHLLELAVFDLAEEPAPR